MSDNFSERESFFNPIGIVRLKKNFDAGLVLLALAGVIAAPLMWIYQVFFWLQNGSWKSISVSDGLLYLGGQYPQFEWVGVQKIVEWLPLSIALFVVGLLTTVAILKNK